MAWLHRSDDAERGKARNIVKGNHLGVLDAMARVAFAVGRAGRGKRIQRDAVGAVADGVQGDLEAGFVALDHHFLQLLRLDAQDAAIRRVVSIGRKQGRGARPERAIGDRFQRPGFQPGIGSSAVAPHLLKPIERR